MSNKINGNVSGKHAPPAAKANTNNGYVTTVGPHSSNGTITFGSGNSNACSSSTNSIPSATSYTAGTITTTGSSTTYIPGGGFGTNGVGANSNYNFHYTPASNIIYGNDKKYMVFKLPDKRIPNKVYVSGRMVTLGVIGTDVQAAYMGDVLIFSPGELNVIQYNSKLTVSIDYGDFLYHYNIAPGIHEANSNIVLATLVSNVKQR